MRTSKARVNIISLEIKDDTNKIVQQGSIVMRTTRAEAQKAIDAGTHNTTSKGKLKSYLNKSSKLLKNKKFLKTHTDFERLSGSLGKGTSNKTVIMVTYMRPWFRRSYAKELRVSSYSSL